MSGSFQLTGECFPPTHNKHQEEKKNVENICFTPAVVPSLPHVHKVFIPLPGEAKNYSFLITVIWLM